MLAPADRRPLLDVLAPPDGYTLDHGVGTTYTLDLLALLRVPLAATALPWSGSGDGPVDNPFALLTALRRNAGRISLFCHAGAAKVPANHIPLLAFLESSVHPVTPPTPGGVFHPKRWLLRFAPEYDDRAGPIPAPRPLPEPDIRSVVGRRPLTRRRAPGAPAAQQPQPPTG